MDIEDILFGFLVEAPTLTKLAHDFVGEGYLENERETFDFGEDV